MRIVKRIKGWFKTTEHELTRYEFGFIKAERSSFLMESDEYCKRTSRSKDGWQICHQGSGVTTHISNDEYDTKSVVAKYGGEKIEIISKHGDLWIRAKDLPSTDIDANSAITFGVFGCYRVSSFDDAKNMPTKYQHILAVMAENYMCSLMRKEV